VAQQCNAACIAGLHSAADAAVSAVAAASHVAPLAAAGLASAGHTTYTYYRNAHESIVTYNLPVLGDVTFYFSLPPCFFNSRHEELRERHNW